MKPHDAEETANLFRLFFSAPALLLFLCGVLACVALLASGSGRLERLTTLSSRAANRLARPHAVLTLWGFAAAVLLIVLVSALSSVKSLVAITLLFIAATLVLGAVGLGTSLLTIGRAALAALRPDVPADDLAALRVGFPILLLASGVPFLGWVLAVLALASGVGAVLEGLARREK